MLSWLLDPYHRSYDVLKQKGKEQNAYKPFDPSIHSVSFSSPDDIKSEYLEYKPKLEPKFEEYNSNTNLHKNNNMAARIIERELRGKYDGKVLYVSTAIGEKNGWVNVRLTKHCCIVYCCW